MTDPAADALWEKAWAEAATDATRSIEEIAADLRAGLCELKDTCEPYANGRGWWHVPGCNHIDWSDW
jgi:hypothetical protein